MPVNGSHKTLLLRSPNEVCQAVGERARDLRLAQGRRQADVAEAAGVALSTLKRFERTGTVGFEVIARVAFALGAEDSFDALFPERDPRTLDEVLTANRMRQRARIKR